MGLVRRLLVQTLVVASVAAATVLGTASAANAAVSCTISRGDTYASAYCTGQYSPDGYPGWPLFYVYIDCYVYRTGEVKTVWGPGRWSDRGVWSTAYCPYASELVGAHTYLTW